MILLWPWLREEELRMSCIWSSISPIVMSTRVFTTSASVRSHGENVFDLFSVAGHETRSLYADIFPTTLALIAVVQCTGQCWIYSWGSVSSAGSWLGASETYLTVQGVALLNSKLSSGWWWYDIAGNLISHQWMRLDAIPAVHLRWSVWGQPNESNSYNKSMICVTHSFMACMCMLYDWLAQDQSVVTDCSQEWHL